MRKKDKKKKEFKPIDIERLVYHTSTWICWVVCLIIIVNNVWLHVEWLSGFCIGVDICLIVMMIVVSRAGHNNFKYEMAEFDRRFNEIKKQSEEALRVLKEGGEKDAKKKLQSGRKQDTTNDNEEA